MLMCDYTTLITVISIHKHTTKFIFAVITRMAQITMDGVHKSYSLYNAIVLLYIHA